MQILGKIQRFPTSSRKSPVIVAVLSEFPRNLLQPFVTNLALRQTPKPRHYARGPVSHSTHGSPFVFVEKRGDEQLFDEFTSLARYVLLASSGYCARLQSWERGKTLVDDVPQYDQLRSTEITDEDGLTYSALATAVSRRAPLVALSLAIVVLFQGCTKVIQDRARINSVALFCGRILHQSAKLGESVHRSPSSYNGNELSAETGQH